MNQRSKPLLANLAQLAADHDYARASADRSGDPMRLAADLAQNVVAVLVVEHAGATDPGYQLGLARAISLLGGHV